MTLSAPAQRAVPPDLEQGQARIGQATLLFAVDHARAGHNFFIRLFDRHPEVLTVPHVSYLYDGLLNLAAGRPTLPAEAALRYMMGTSNVSLLVSEPTPKIRAQFLRMGNDPDAPLDRDLLRRVLRTLIGSRQEVTPAEVIRAVYLGYALATGRPLHSVRYLLVSESVSSRRSILLTSVRRESPPARVIHLVRDPRANFVSLRHQYVNQWGSMYPLERLLWGEGGCTWIWALQTTAQGAQAVRAWKAGADPGQVLTVRNEDLNLRFTETLRRITEWLGVGWFEGWSSPDYVPTSNGRPWLGISAFSSAYQPFTRGPLPNDPPGQDRFFRPNREVTEQWKKRLLPREVAFLEALYEEEMREMGYTFLHLTQGRSRFRALTKILLPLAGELPPFHWYTRFASSVDLLRKLTYPLVLPPAYLLSRLWFLLLYARGEFRR